MSTPWLDAVRARDAGDVDKLYTLALAAIPTPPSARQLVGWPSMTDSERHAALVAAAASGVSAEAGTHPVVVDRRNGRRIPPPPPPRRKAR